MLDWSDLCHDGDLTRRHRKVGGIHECAATPLEAADRWHGGMGRLDPVRNLSFTSPHMRLQ